MVRINMNFVYPYKRKPNDFLISHSIRLVEHYYPESRIIIIGDHYKKYEHIPFKDYLPLRGANVTNKLLHVAEKLSNFVFMNDDFLINDKFDFDKHHKHTAKLQRREGKASVEWNDAVDNTKHWLMHNNLPTDSYECHQPLLIESDKLISLFDKIEWKTNAHFIKSLYCNVYPKQTLTIDNTKLIRPDIKKSNILFDIIGCLSIGEGYMDSVGSNYIKALI